MDIRGSNSPIRQIKLSKVDPTVGIRSAPVSPTYMEVLSNSSSPKTNIGLTETKIKSTNVNKVVNNIFRDWCISTNNAKHNGGRVWVLWNPNLVDIQFLEYDSQYIHMQVSDKASSMHFTQTLVYAFNEIGDRESLWANLKRINGFTQGPWVIGGDFNCVRTGNERLGGNVSAAKSEPFIDCLAECNMMDIPTVGAFFTWNNKQPPSTRVYSRIDRLVVNHDWLLHYPNYYANFLPEGMFDHNPCLGSSPVFLDCVAKRWNHEFFGTRMYRLVRKLKSLKYDLKQINGTHFSDIENAATIAEIKLYHLQQRLVNAPGDLDLMQQEYDALQIYKSLHEAKMQFLKQKAKAHWIKEGDMNSSYFHGIIKARRSRNL
ncbi:uncharacterized protein LOC141631859 [Silene latifolia]|uniref:uncharacterized protein LOC141631859 n=1 Tax=Silene latifolia TaxID=37657 RepID=UPI003D7845E4